MSTFDDYKFGRYTNFNKRTRFWYDFLPQNWSAKQLKFVLQRNDGGIWGDEPNGSVQDRMVLRSTEQLVDGSWKLDDPAIRKISVEEFIKTKLEVGDLVITKSSGSELHIGKTSIVTDEIAKLNCSFSNFMQRLRPDSSTSSRFLYYLLNSVIGREQMAWLSNTTTGLANLSGSLLNELVFLFPPLDQQRAITTYLDRETARIDDLIAVKEELTETLVENKRATIANFIPFAPQEINGTTNPKWTERKLKYITDVVGGGTPSKDNIEYWGGNIPWVSPKDMHTSEIWDTEDHVTPEAVEESSTQLVEQGAVLVVCRSGILKHTIPCALNQVAVTLNQDMKALIPHPGVSSRYLQNFIVGHQDTLLSLWRKAGATVESLESEYMMNTKIPLPEYVKQQEISDQLDREFERIEAVAVTTRQTIALLRQRRTALIAAAVTGQMEIAGLV